MECMLLAGAEGELLLPAFPPAPLLPQAVAARAKAATPRVPRIRMAFRIAGLTFGSLEVRPKVFAAESPMVHFAVITRPSGGDLA
jgi:hypothetical protein